MSRIRPKITRQFGRIAVETEYSASFVNAIKTVIPQASRNYSGGIWTFDPSYYSALLVMLAHYWGNNYIDSVGGVSEPQTTSWKEPWEVFKSTDGKRADKEKPNKGWDLGKTASQTVYATLYVTADAPKQVITAAYRALASLHHPDNGGDTEVMARINAAYQELKKKDRV